MHVTLTADKTEKKLNLIHDALHDEVITIRQVASLISKVNATAPDNPIAALFTKNLENDKIQALHEKKFNYDAYMSLSTKSRNNLCWLRDNLKNRSAHIRIPKPDFATYTDASCEGWGCYNPQIGIKKGGALEWRGAEWPYQHSRIDGDMVQSADLCQGKNGDMSGLWQTIQQLGHV